MLIIIIIIVGIVIVVFMVLIYRMLSEEINRVYFMEMGQSIHIALQNLVLVILQLFMINIMMQLNIIKIPLVDM